MEVLFPVPIRPMEELLVGSPQTEEGSLLFTRPLVPLASQAMWEAPSNSKASMWLPREWLKKVDWPQGTRQQGAAAAR